MKENLKVEVCNYKLLELEKCLFVVKKLQFFSSIYVGTFGLGHWIKSASTLLKKSIIYI